MKFTLLPESRLTPRKIAGHMAIVLILMGVILMVALRKDQARVDQIHEMIAQCRADQSSCIGGFIVWNDGLIELLDNCKLCRPQVFDVSDVKNLPSSRSFERVHHIVPHGGEEWRNTIVEYAKQVVRNERP